MGGCWVSSRSGWLLELLTELKMNHVGLAAAEGEENRISALFLGMSWITRESAALLKKTKKISNNFFPIAII